MFKTSDRKYWIAIPKIEEGYMTVQHHTYTKKNGDVSTYRSLHPRTSQGSHWEYFKMPKDVYDYKIYPTCTMCNLKYVPIHKGDTECFKCNFLKK